MTSQRPSADELGSAYVRLALAIEQHRPGYIDAYFGAPSLKSHAMEAGKLPIPELMARARELAVAIVAYRGDAHRGRFLARQVAAMQTALRILSGEDIPFVEEVKGLYDVHPPRVPDDVLEQARRDLDALVPGEGTLNERLQARRKQFEVGGEMARELFQLACAETRRRTLELFALPAGEEVELRYVADKPWSAYNWYLGRYRSLIEINTDSPFHVTGLLGLLAHEGYPGHHSEHSLKESAVYERLGWLEGSILLINAPECVVSEGIATAALDVIFAEGEADEWQRAELYPRAGVHDPLTPETVRRIAAAGRALEGVSGNAALMLHVDRRPPEEVIEYLLRYSSRTRAEAERSLRFMTDPIFRSYTFTYSAGHRLVVELCSRLDKRNVFARLLDEQLTPSDLVEWRDSVAA
jgi:hypothetical protein